MMFLAFEDVGEEVAADIVAHALAMGNGVLEQRDRLFLDREVGLEDFLDRFADAQAAEQLEVGEATKEEDAVGELVGMLHLVDRLFAFERGEACDAPIVEHAIMQQILVDRGQLVLERFVEEIDDFFVALHGVCPVISSWEWSGRIIGAAAPSGQGQKWRKTKKNQAVAAASMMILRANDRHWPHLGLRPNCA